MSVRPGNTTDVAALVRAGWQWCATHGLWFQVIGYKKFRGGPCETCRDRIGREMDHLASRNGAAA